MSVGLIVVFLGIIVCCLADLVPSHVYLSLTGDSNAFQVTFTTSSLPNVPIVSYWPNDIGQKSAVTITGDSSNTFSFQNPNITTVDYITTFTLTNLTRDVFYTYEVCGDSKNQTGTCREFSFKSLPSDDSVLNIGFYGDLGSNATALINSGPGGLIQYAANYSADFIVHYGDLAYNLASDFGKNGNIFMDRIEPITSKIPYIVTPGNHEYKEYGDPFYYTNWFRGQSQLGQNSNSSNPTLWYSFDIGSVHIVAMSTEVYCEDTGNIAAQYAWLEADLAAVRARDVQPWVVVFGHRQMYYGAMSSHSSRMMRLGIQCFDEKLTNCDFDMACDFGIHCAYSLEQLLDKYSADLFISGHVHTYARMYPIAPDHTYEAHNVSLYLNPQHPTYIISGAPGIQSVDLSLPEGVSDGINLSVAKAVTGFGYSHMQVYNKTHLFIKQIDAETADIVDSFWIVKDYTNKPELKDYLLLPSTQTVCD